MFSRKYRETWVTAGERKRIWSSVDQIQRSTSWQFFERFKLVANSKFHQTGSGQNPAGQRSRIASFPRHLASEDSTGHSKHATKGEGGLRFLKKGRRKSEVASTRRVSPLGNLTSLGQAEGSAPRYQHLAERCTNSSL